MKPYSRVNQRHHHFDRAWIKSAKIGEIGVIRVSDVLSGRSHSV